MTRLLRSYLSPYRKTLVGVVLLLLLQSLGQLYLPSLNADIINNGVVTGDAAYIVRVGGLMLLVTLLLSLAAVIAVYYSARTAMRFGREVRGGLFRHVQEFALREVNVFGAPSLITRNTNDVQQVQMLVLMGLTIMVSAPIMAVGGAVMAMRENLTLSALLLVIIPVMVAVILAIARPAIAMFREMQVRVDRVNRVLREKLGGVRVIRAFVRTEHERQRFSEANDELTATALRVTRLFALAMPSLMLILNLTSVAILWFGGHLVASGSMPIGNLTAFLAYVMQILQAVMMAVMMVVMVPRAAASAERIQKVLDTEPALREPTEPVTPEATHGLVELRDVEFRYPGAEAPVLRNVSLTCRPGEMTAIIGSTGSGKTTLVNLVARLYDVTAGQVLLDGVDVRRLPMERLWSSLGFVPQRSFLFSGTVASNLRFGRPDATEQEMWHALQVAQAADFVRELPGGLESPVDQGGRNFSGGQRQRLSIARAVIRRPAVYVLDDSFSALDFATDAGLRAALRDETADATVLVVAQRVSTVLQADQIIVLDGGHVVGTGPHHQLLETCDTYREIVLSQLSLEEVA